MKNNIYNYKQVMEREIPVIPRVTLLTRLTDRFADASHKHVLLNKFDVKLLSDANDALIRWLDVKRPIKELSKNMQRCIWNGYVLGAWPIRHLKNAHVDSWGYIKYSDIEHDPDTPDYQWQAYEDFHSETYRYQDHWTE